MKRQEFQKRFEEASKLKEECSRKSDKISLFRLGFFLGFLIAFIVWLIRGYSILWLVSLVFIVGFIMLVFIHQLVSRKEKYYLLLRRTLQEYLDRFSNGWLYFPDGGMDSVKKEFTFLSDLDIIGDASLFKYINVCKTSGGRRKLISRLIGPDYSPEKLDEEQMMMKEIAENIGFSLDFQVGLKEFGEQTSVNLDLLMPSEDVKVSWLDLVLGAVFLLFTLTTFLLALLKVVPWSYSIAGFFIQLLYSYVFSYKHQKVFDDLPYVTNMLTSLSGLFKVVLEADFTAPSLKQYQHDIRRFGNDAIRHIGTIGNLESFRKNMVGYLLNGLVPINILIVLSYSRFMKKYGNDFHKATGAIEELEVLTSLAIIGQTKENITLPKLSQEIALDFTDIRHPLLNEDECIPNSYNRKTNVNIITGSNMSGKTSFLRTIGINLVLMKAGAYVNATAFTAASFKLFTSMRVGDDLAKGISTFYAELLRIKEAIEYSQLKKPMLVLIDEIFKGTNSNDRIQGAISLIEKLNLHNVLLFISTHDFELCGINTVPVSNFHFSEHYEGDQIRFDYKLKDGRCQTTNARYLMKLAGIIDR